MSHKDRLEAIGARCRAARPGPWSAFIEGRDFLGGSSMIRIGALDAGYEDLHLDGYDLVVPDADFDFIAHAREDIPFLLAEIARLQLELDRV